MPLERAVYRCGDCRIDAPNRRFARGGVELALEPRVFAVVLQLLAQPGAVLTRERLLEQVWGHQFVTASTLNRVIALARRAFGDDVDEPRFIQTVYGTGYRYIGPVSVEVATPVGTGASFAPPVAVQLPARLTPLIGREAELARMRERLRASRGLTLVGTGGIGKTQCALEFARREAGTYTDGVWFFDLVLLQRDADWLPALAQALAIPPAADAAMFVQVCRALAGRRALLVLDNCEHVAEGLGARVLALLRATAAIDVLATSRQPLNYVGESILRMPSLALPQVRVPADAGELPAVAAAPAVELLLRRIQAVEPAFELDHGNADAIIEICARLDGLPLALELAAARFALLSPGQVLERLKQRFAFLVSDLTGRDPRHRSLVALLDWSFGLLSAQEQRFLAWLGVFVQSWSMDGAVALGVAVGHDPESVVDLLGGLVNKSLVVVESSARPPRYRLLETVREFALVKLDARGEAAGARAAHLAWVQRIAEQSHLDIRAGHGRECLASLVHEHGNIDAALEYAATSRERSPAALAIVGALLLYFSLRSILVPWRRATERALAAAAVTATLERERALLCRGVIGVHLVIADDTTDRALLEAARLAREVHDAWGEGYASAYYALRLIDLGHCQDAEPLVARAALLARELDDAALRVLAALAAGWLELARDAPQRAIDALGAVIGESTEVPLRNLVEIYLGLAALRLGDRRGACGAWLAAVRRSIELGAIRGVAGSVEGCGYLMQAEGRDLDAVRLLAAASHIRERTGLPLFRFWSRHHEPALTELRATLGTAAFEAAWARGEATRPEDAAHEVARLLEALLTSAV